MIDSEVQQEPKQTRVSSGSHSNNYKAYAFATCSSFFLVFVQLNIKQLSKHFSPLLILGLRGSILFIFNFLYLNYSKQPIHVPNPILFRNIIKRALASSITVILYLGSIKFIPIGIANALFNTMPIITFFIQCQSMKEIIRQNKGAHWINFIIIILSFIGILLIIQPAFLFNSNKSVGQTNYLFYYVALFSAFTGSFSMIYLHDLRGKVSQLIVLQHGYFIQSAASYLLYLITMVDSSTNQNEKSFSYLHTVSAVDLLKILSNIIMMVIFAFLTQFLQAKAMYLSTPAHIMPFNYFSVVFGMLFDILAFDSKYNLLMIIGMIMASVGLFSKFLFLHLDTLNKYKQKLKNKQKPAQDEELNG